MVALEDERERMTLVRQSRGRNFEGMDSHVLRPIITAFVRPAPAAGVLPGGVEVTRLKCAMSPGRRQARSPPAPMPREEAAAATTAAMSDMNATGILSLESILGGEELRDQDGWRGKESRLSCWIWMMDDG